MSMLVRDSVETITVGGAPIRIVYWRGPSSWTATCPVAGLAASAAKQAVARERLLGKSRRRIAAQERSSQ